MKTLKYGALIVCAAGGAVQAGVVEAQAMAIDGLSFPAGGPSGFYFAAPALANADGVFYAGGPFSDSFFDGDGEVIGNDLSGGSVISSDSLTSNGDGTQTLVLTLVSTSGELFASGFTDGTNPLDTAGLLYGGADGFGAPLNYGGETVLAAELDAFDVSGVSFLGMPFDLLANAIDVQQGSFGVGFAPGSVGLGIAEVTLSITLTPAPGPLALLGLGGLCGARRRR